MIALLDNGHGGIINGVYQTKGKCSPIWDDGSQLFEGEFNRAIVSGIIEQLKCHNIEYVNLVPELTDIKLEDRVKRANKYKPNNCFYLSIHSNAGGGNGSEIFTSVGGTKSDRIATVFGEEYKREFPNRKLRADFSDSDLDKELDFYVLKKTRMPSILTESFFMDNEEECKSLLMTDIGRQRIVSYHVNSIFRVYRELY